MANTFQPLECDSDILIIGKDTFTVERFKELTQKRIQERLWRKYADKNRNITGSITSLFFGEKLEIIDNEVRIALGDIQLVFPTGGIGCKILKLGSTNWKPVKLRI